MRFFNKSHFTSALLTIVPVTLIALGCSGTTIRQSTDDGHTSSPTDPNGTGTGSGGDGGGSSSSTDGGSSGLPATCPCPLDSYCDLASNTCLPGCTDSSQCSGGRTCDTTKRVCQTVCTGAACNAQACPIPAAPAGSDASTTCNGVAIQGASVPTTCSTGAAPTPSGGTVRDGVYVMVSSQYFGTQACPTGQLNAVWDICGSTWATAQQSTSAAVSTFSMSATIAATSVSLGITCPAPAGTTSAGFDATDSTLNLYWADGAGGTFVEHYAKE